MTEVSENAAEKHGSKTENVLHLVSSIWEKRPDAANRRREAERGASRASDADERSNRAVRELSPGYTLFEIVGDRELSAETGPWRRLGSPEPRIRLTGQSVYAVRSDTGQSPMLVEVADGVVSAVHSPRVENARAGFAAILGRALIDMGIDLGLSAESFGALHDNAGDLHFLDNPPDRLELDDNAIVHAVDPVTMPKVVASTASLMVSDCAFARCPVSVSVSGNLTLSATRGLVLPSHLHVGGDLQIELSDADMLPSRFHVGRDLNMSFTAISAFPEVFHVGRNIRANNSAITALQGGFTCRGDLDLRDSALSQLSWGLEVKGSLDVSGTRITAIPGDAVIGGDLMVDDKVDVPITVRVGGKILFGRPYGYDTARSNNGRR